ncbi:MAG: FecR domain-containing protein [Bacteroidota bacterium]
MKEITPEILERYYSNTCSAEERKRVEHWLNDQKAQSPNEEQLLSRSWQEISGKTHKKPVAPPLFRKKTIYRTLGAAAALAILISIGIYGYRNSTVAPSKTTVWATVNYKKISVARGEKRTLELPDGSTVVVNSESELQVPKEFSKESRIVYLKGHAHFDVNHDKSRPFIIYTQSSKTQVLGTSFDINTHSTAGETEVIVTSGKVAFSQRTDQRDEVVLAENDRAILTDKRIFTDQVVAPALTAWKENRLLFDDSTLKEISPILERWYDIDITVENPNLLSIDFNLDMDDPSLTDILNELGFLGDFEYRIEDKSVIIY